MAASTLTAGFTAVGIHQRRTPSAHTPGDDYELLMRGVLRRMVFQSSDGDSFAPREDLCEQLTDLLERHLRLEYPGLAPLRELLDIEPMDEGYFKVVKEDIFSLLSPVLGRMRPADPVELVIRELENMAQGLFLVGPLHQAARHMSESYGATAGLDVSAQLTQRAKVDVRERCFELGYVGLINAFESLTYSQWDRLYSDMLADKTWLYSDGKRDFEERYRGQFHAVLINHMEQGFIPRAP